MYLDAPEDLLSVANPSDYATSWIEGLVEDSSILLKRQFGGAPDESLSPTARSLRFGPSRDPLVHIFPSTFLTRLVRISVSILVISMLLTPVIACHFLGDKTARLVVVLAAVSVFIGTVSGFTHARMLELLVIGAT